MPLGLLGAQIPLHSQQRRPAITAPLNTQRQIHQRHAQTRKQRDRRKHRRRRQPVMRSLRIRNKTDHGRDNRQRLRHSPYDIAHRLEDMQTARLAPADLGDASHEAILPGEVLDELDGAKDFVDEADAGLGDFVDGFALGEEDADGGDEHAEAEDEEGEAGEGADAQVGDYWGWGLVKGLVGCGGTPGKRGERGKRRGRQGGNRGHTYAMLWQ